MKKFIILIVLLISSQCLCAELNFTWSANTELDLKGYKLYCGPGPGEYNIVHTLFKRTEYSLIVGSSQYFALTAYDSTGNESGFSNEVYFNYSEIDTTAPSNPINFIFNTIYR